MPRMTNGTTGTRRAGTAKCCSGVYSALLAREEARFAQHGGRRLLIVDTMHVIGDPPPLLADLRAGRPAAVNLFRVPKRYRPDEVNPSSPVVVYPDGRIEQTE